MQKKRLAAEALMIGTLIVRGVQLGDELKRLYKVHKPKKAIGFVRTERIPLPLKVIREGTAFRDRKRWFRR
jgi:hypothetical protein